MEIADNDVTRVFWGEGADWASQPTDTSESGEFTTPRGGIGATVGRWWSSATSGRRTATRTHAPATFPSSGDETDDGVVDFDDDDHDDHDDDQGCPESEWDEAWETASPEPPRPGVDPLLARLGGLTVVLTLLVPVVMGFTSDDGEAVRTASIAVDVPVAASGDQPAEQPAPVAPTTPAPSAASPVADATVAVEPTTTAAVVATPITAPVVQALAVDECDPDYEVAVGDFWIRIADGSGVALADLLAVNDATVATPLYPGRSICLPDGAVIPPPPPAPTATAPTSTVGTTTQRSSTSSNNPTGSAPPASTTPATTTPAPAPVVTAGAGEVETIIRSVWPDELEDRALEVARRESNLVPTAKNSCCYGVFQVYWSVHRSWLSGLGITSADQLYDPATNARAALTLYERAGGWGPWGG
jgi:hypothetical protein